MLLQEIFKGKQYKIEVLEDEDKELTIHQLTISKPMHKNMGKYTCTINDIQTGSYLDVEGKSFITFTFFHLKCEKIQIQYLHSKSIQFYDIEWMYTFVQSSFIQTHKNQNDMTILI